MITRNNIKEVMNQLSDKDKKRLKSTSKDYCILELHTFNVGSFTSMKLTNLYGRYAKLSDHGNCILSVDDALAILE